MVFAMKVAETMSFQQYWDDSRFRSKKPNLLSSKKNAFGDNIYSYSDGRWKQTDSHHSFADGSPNPRNIANDTQTDRVLISSEYIYWGGSGPVIPERFRNVNGIDVCAGRGYKSNFPASFVISFVAWLKEYEEQGYVGEPLDWHLTP